MAGTGEHLHHIVKTWLGISSWSGCGCQALAEQMDKRGPAWVKQPRNFRRIVHQMRATARKAPQWRLRLAGYLPGVKWPIRAMVNLAIQRAEEDIQKEK